jgi:hypothetical protein
MLPKVEHPIYSFKVPSSGKMQNFRPFLVKEEKILLMAKESLEEADIMRAVKQVVNNCCPDSNFNVNEITITDLGYLFVRLRAVSIDNIVKTSYRDFEDGKVYDFEIDLSKVEVVQDKQVDNRIKVTKNVGLILKHPTAGLYEDRNSNSDEHAVIAKCIDKIYEDDELFDTKQVSLQELLGFIENLDINSYNCIKEFLDNAPRLQYVIKYKNLLDHDRTITLTTLNDFFSFR